MVCLPPVLHPCSEFGYLFFEASSSCLLRVCFAPERSSVRQKSGVVQLYGVSQGQIETEHHLGPHELEQPTEHFGQGAKEVIPAPGGQKQNKTHTKHSDSEIAAPPPFAGLIHTAALTLSLRRTVLLLGVLKISKCRFIMTGADKFAGEMQAVSLSCWRPVLIN